VQKTDVPHWHLFPARIEGFAGVSDDAKISNMTGDEKRHPGIVAVGENDSSGDSVLTGCENTGGVDWPADRRVGRLGDCRSKTQLFRRKELTVSVRFSGRGNRAASAWIWAA
jgi:hypothetical protein